MDDAPKSGPLALSVVIRDVDALQQSFMSSVKNGGLVVETTSILPMGGEVLLMVILPDNPNRAPVIGKVVWITPKDNRDGKPPAVGIQFKDDRAGLYTRIQNILSGLPPYKGDILSF